MGSTPGSGSALIAYQTTQQTYTTGIFSTSIMNTSAHASLNVHVGDRAVDAFLVPSDDDAPAHSRAAADTGTGSSSSRLARLTLFGGFAAGQVSKRWFQSFSIPGYSAYEADQRTLKTFGNGEAAPLVAVVTVKGDVDESGRRRSDAFEAAAGPTLAARTSSYFTTGNRCTCRTTGERPSKRSSGRAARASPRPRAQANAKAM